MKIIVAGDGKVGQMLTRQLSREGHDLTLIDSNPEALEATMEHYDVMSVVGNCASMAVLRNAGVESADLLITATGADETNLLCCMTAHGMNPAIHTIARIRKPEYMESTYTMRRQFALSLVVNPERQAAREIDRLLRYPGFIKREKFANGLVELVGIRIKENSALCNKPLNQMVQITHCQVLVCVVQREGRTIAPTGDFILKAGDTIYVTASASNLLLLMKSLNLDTTPIRTVTICGGGRIAYYLTQLLIREGVRVKIIEQDMERCEVLADVLPEACIVHGDVSLQDTMEREEITSSDALVAMTGLDELNVILSIYARRFDVPMVITKLGRAENLELINQLPVGTIVSPKELSCDTIVRYVRAKKNRIGAAVTVHSIADGLAEAIEFLADENTAHLNEPLKSIELKENVLIASITHGRSIVFPNGDSSFSEGDRIVVVATGDIVIEQLNDIFAE